VIDAALKEETARQTGKRLKPVFFCLDGNMALVKKVVDLLDAELGELELRAFPDGESYIRVLTECQGRQVVLMGSLDNPDAKVLRWLLLAETLRDLGALKVGLLVPYLAYMRQDMRFKQGEGITSRYFAKLISQYFDWLITVDPHLHRYDTLDEIYTIPTRVLHGADLIAAWIEAHIPDPLLVGPDSESEQWVSATARVIGCPCLVLDKVRYGDRKVDISAPHADAYKQRTPVMIDDIISTGHTMIETTISLQKQGFLAAIGVGVHGLFADQAYEEMIAAGMKAVYCTDSIAHKTSVITLAPLLAQGVTAML
jgi:ribose-phosphate pyrophosphokinase